MTYFSELSLEMNPCPFWPGIKARQPMSGSDSKDKCRVPAVPDRNGPCCGHTASGRPQHATQYFCLLHVQTYAHLHVARHVYTRDARGHRRTEAVVSDNPQTLNERRQDTRVSTHRRGVIKFGPAGQKLMHGGGPDHNRRRPSRSKHLGLPRVFRLTVDDEFGSKHCRVVWTDGKRVGVSFE